MSPTTLSDLLSKGYIDKVFYKGSFEYIEYMLNYTLKEELENDLSKDFYDFQNEKEETIVSLDVNQKIFIEDSTKGVYKVKDSNNEYVDIFIKKTTPLDILNQQSN